MYAYAIYYLCESGKYCKATAFVSELRNSNTTLNVERQRVNFDRRTDTCVYSIDALT